MLLALLMCFSTIFGLGTTAFAAGEQAEVYMIGFPRDGDANYGGEWGHPDLNYMNGWSSGKSSYTNIRAMNSYEGNICYCIEPGVPQDTGDTFTSWDENFWDNYPAELNSTISPDEIKTFIGRILQYGYTGPISLNWRSQNEGGDKLAYAVATQLLIWETVIGERNSDFGKVDTGSYDAVIDSVGVNHPLYTQIMSYYNSIASSVKTHATLPSFLAKSTGKAQEVEMEWNGSEYIATLTDSNGVLGNYSFTANVIGIDFSISGNTLTITADEAPTDTVTITASKKNSQRMGVITWTDGTNNPNSGIQDVVTYAQSVTDPVKGYIKLEVSLGSAKIVKTSEDGEVAGITFTITGDGINETVTTGSNGEFQIDNLTPGIYTVTEQTYDKYEPQEVRRVTVVSGQVATVTFNNVLKRGDLAVYKNSEDGLNEGITFHLYGTSLSGHAVDEYAMTDSDGIAYFGDVLIGSGYVLEEVDTAIRYVVPDDQSAAIEWNTVTNKSFANVLKKWNATVTKSDAQTGTAQGDASLAGAVYEIAAAEDIYTLDGTLRCAAGEVVDTITTGEDGTAVSKPLYLGKYTIKEITAPGGMIINTEVHTAELVYAGQEIEITETSTSFCNDRQKVSVSLNKVMETDDLFGIGYKGEVTAVTFGLYAAEDLTAADGCVIPADGLIEILSVNENGYAVGAVDLPFGSYYLQEMSTDSHYILSDAKYPFTFSYAGQDIPLVEITANEGEPISNELIYGSIVGAKVDEDGIGLQGATIGLFHADEKEFNVDTAIKTAISDEDGSFAFNQIPYGNWVIREIESPAGYVLTDAIIPVTIAEDGVVLEIQLTNTRIRGNVQLTKVDANYPDNKLAGAEFELYVDINENGKLDSEDELLGMLTELSDGVYQTNDLLYGSYLVKEKTAPVGFYLDPNAYAFQITENGVTVIVENEAGKGFINNVQTGSIRIEKTSEDKVVKGFTFKVEGTDITGQPFSKQYVTDENGEIHIEGLRVGDYVISEVANEATEKYELPPDVTVTVLEGKTTVAKFHNKLIPEIPDVPKTGDESKTGLWGALALISLAGAGVTAYLAFGKKHRKENK